MLPGGGDDSVTPEQIAEIVARWTSIPVTRLMSTEKEKLLRMEKILAQNVVGQPEAVRAVANAIRLSRSGLGNAQRPIASFLMAGPSGTGKTLLSKTVSYSRHLCHLSAANTDCHFCSSRPSSSTRPTP